MDIDLLIDEAKLVELKLNNSFLDKIILDIIKNNNFFILNEEYKKILYPDVKFVIYNENAYNITYKLLQDIQLYENTYKTGFIKPIITNIKLANREYIIDINNNRYIYILDVNQKILDNKNILNEYLLISKCISFPFIVEYINDKTIFTNNFLELFNSINKKISYKFTKNDKKRNLFIKNVFDEIIFNENDKNENIVCLDDISNNKYNYMAYDILYSYHETKEKFVDVCRNICKKYFKDMQITIIHNQNIIIPTEFRLNKTTIFIENKFNKTQKIFICNLYNILSYSVIPCYIIPKRNYYLADPIVKQKFNLLNLLYISILNNNKVNLLSENIKNNIYNTFNDIENKIYNYDIEWIGLYRDEDYDKIKYNQKNKNEKNNFEIFI